MLSIQERENLTKSVEPKYTGFTPRPMERMTTATQPTSTLNLDCNSFLQRPQSGKFPRSKTYEMWLEAGKHELPKPNRPDRIFSSMLWRQIRKHYNLEMSRNTDRISDAVAKMYPVNVPHSSAMGDVTYSKFIQETPIIQDKRLRNALIQHSTNDYREFERLRLRSEMRNPPLNKNGFIIQPDSLPRNLHHHTAYAQNVKEAIQLNDRIAINVFGHQIQQVKSPNVSKLTCSLNNAEYEKIRITNNSPQTPKKQSRAITQIS